MSVLYSLNVLLLVKVCGMRESAGASTCEPAGESMRYA
jgi:hypothetical protein